MLTTLLLIFVHTFLIMNLIQTSECFVGRFGQCESNATSFRTLYKLSLVECMDECERRQDCHRLNFRRSTRECIFHSTSILQTGSTATVSDNTSCVIIQRNEIDTGTQCVCPQGMACQSDGLCKFEECKAPTSIPSLRGNISGNVLTTGSKVKVECNSPFILRPNNPYAMCNDGGDWEGPICTLFCNDPCQGFPYTEPVSLGISIEGEKRTYTCKPGFYLLGNNSETSFEITCKVYITWSYWSLPPDYCVTDTIVPRHPRNIEYIGCTQYEVNPIAVTYDAALGLCEPYGRLARLDTESLQSDLQQRLNDKNYPITRGPFYWIQGQKDLIDGQWKFDDGVKLSYFLWGDGQPNGGANDCIFMSRRLHFLWNDIRCDYLIGYICEYKYTV